MENIIYKIDGPMYWNTREACFISEEEALSSSLEVVYLKSSSGESDKEYLYKTLKFYDYPLGELATLSDNIDEIIESNKDYLTKVLIMSILEVDIPNEALEHFSNIKKRLNTFSKDTIKKFILES